jgi:hypothetical protein
MIVLRDGQAFDHASATSSSSSLREGVSLAAMYVKYRSRSKRPMRGVACRRATDHGTCVMEVRSQVSAPFVRSFGAKGNGGTHVLIGHDVHDM